MAELTMTQMPAPSRRLRVGSSVVLALVAGGILFVAAVLLTVEY